MASLVRQHGWWYAQFYDRSRVPQRRQIPLKTRTKKTAEQLRRELEDKYRLGQFDPWGGSTPVRKVDLHTLGPAVDAFLDNRAHRRAATVRAYTVSLRPFLATLDRSTPVKAIGPPHVYAFLDGTKANDVTRHFYRRHLRAFFRWLVRQGVLQRDITEDVQLRRLPSKFPKFLLPEEVQRLVQAIESHAEENPLTTAEEALWIKPVIICTAYLGLRLGEACALRWSAVDLERRLLTVANTDTFTTKSGAERVLPIPDPAYAILAELHGNRSNSSPSECVFRHSRGPLTRLHLSKRFCKFRRLAGLPDHITFHSLRHTTASWLVMNGASLEAVRLFLGHSSIQVTQKYAHLAPDVYACQINAALSGIAHR